MDWVRDEMRNSNLLHGVTLSHEGFHIPMCPHSRLYCLSPIDYDR